MAKRPYKLISETTGGVIGAYADLSRAVDGARREYRRYPRPLAIAHEGVTVRDTYNHGRPTDARWTVGV